MEIRPVPPAAPAAEEGMGTQQARLRAAARDLEAAFLAEMFRHAGLGEIAGAFDGGAGEDHFSSFLRDAQTREMAQNGGIGLADSIFHALKDRADAE